MYSYPNLLNPPICLSPKLKQESIVEPPLCARKRHNSWSDNRDFFKRMNLSENWYFNVVDQQLPKIEANYTITEVKRLKKKDLEEMMMRQKHIALFKSESIIEVKSKLELAENQLQQYLKRTNDLIHQVEDMKIVLKRYVTHFKENDRLATPPIKLTRTVGLQVNDSTTYLEHPKLNLVPGQGSSSPMSDSQIRKSQQGKSPATPILLDTDEESDQDSSQKIDVDTVEAVDTYAELLSHLPALPTCMFGAIQQAGLPPTVPQPTLNAVKIFNHIALSWNINDENIYAQVAEYQMVGLIETSNNTFLSKEWKNIGTVSALELPMSCSIPVKWNETGRSRYHFAIQAKDIHGRLSPFSDIVSITD